MASLTILHPSPNWLYSPPEPPCTDDANPDYLHDLHLDEIVASIIAKRPDYEIRAYFLQPLGDLDAIRYRHELFFDLERPDVAATIESFAAGMREMRDDGEKALASHYPQERQRWHLDGATRYCEAVSELGQNLERLELHSRGLEAIRGWVSSYLASAQFHELQSESKTLRSDLDQIEYSLNIRGNRIDIYRYGREADYSAEIQNLFARFRTGEATQRLRLPPEFGMNHIEGQILERLSHLFPETFAALEAFTERHREFADPTLSRFELESQFYMAVLDWAGRLRKAGLDFCYPEMSATDKNESCADTFDAALAERHLYDQVRVVPNDFELSGPERIFVVSGPNQGGKTTFARLFGQLHYLAAVGLPVPGSKARLFLFDQLFTHFEREEHIESLVGKLLDDLNRIHLILERATSRSVVIMNEIFNSTTFHDARFLGRRVLLALIDLDALGVFVTFIDELSTLDKKTVSLVAGVDPQNPNLRTYKLLRRPADGRSYALSIAEHYGLTYETLKGRLER